MIEPNKIYTASGITARLFDVILTLSEEERHRLLKSLGASQRRCPRIPFLMEVNFETREDKIHGAYIQDISSDGVFLETMTPEETPVEAGSAVRIHFRFREMDDHLTLSGKVVRKDYEGVGIKFTRLDDGTRKRLMDIIESL